jgi:cyclophilin family peptidyl-prolyl cis-trans isomerase
MRRSLCLATALFLLAATGTALAENPSVRMTTSQGTITLELYPDKAPKTVENFLAYVDSGFYAGTTFHRVIEGFMIQGGGFTEDMKKKPTRDPIDNEADNGLKNDRGTIAMARTAIPDSATAQFFINHKDNAFLNHTGKTPRGWGYAVFGKVTDGMEVVDAIAKTPTGAKGPFPKDVPDTPVVIESIERVTE